jgi:hypothetical protein
MKRLLLLLTVALVALCGQHTAHSQISVEAWVQRYHGPGNGNHLANAVAVDGSGNVFVTGEAAGTNGATIKYSGAGVALWTNLYNNGGAKALAVDSSGNVIVTGGSGGINGFSDYATIKYSGAGVPLWTNRYDGAAYSDDLANAVAVDGNGNVFVTGYSASTNVSPYNYDYATIKYSGTGVALWTNRYNGLGNGEDRAIGMTVDKSGDVIVTGSSIGSGGDSYDYATIKYSGAGVALWTNRYDGPWGTDDVATAIAADINGNVFVTGWSGAVTEYYNPDLEEYFYFYHSDFATIAYSGAGAPLWMNRYDAGSFDEARSVAVDGSGNVFVTGYSSGGSSTIKYSGAGVPLWTKFYPGIANAVAVDGGGNVFVTGYGGGNSADYTTLAYSGAGVALWTNRYDGPGNYIDMATAIAVDGGGNVFVTGTSYGTNTYDFVTIKYSSVMAPSLTIARTTTNTIAISWPSPSTGFTLQQNTNNIATPNWNDVLTTPTDNGTTKTVVVNPTAGDRFYRLKSQ